jgi:hypothetical protein
MLPCSANREKSHRSISASVRVDAEAFVRGENQIEELDQHAVLRGWFAAGRGMIEVSTKLLSVELTSA